MTGEAFGITPTNSNETGIRVFYGTPRNGMTHHERKDSTMSRPSYEDASLGDDGPELEEEDEASSSLGWVVEP